MNAVQKQENGTKKLSIIATVATRYGMEPVAFEKTLRATVVPEKCSPEQFAAFLLVASEYNLNPLLKEIYCFPKQGGGVIPVVSIDGWSGLINSNKQMDGLEFEDHLGEDEKIVAITCRIWRKDRSKPIMVTEYMEECVKKGSEPWQKWPRRMLRHKAMIQCARYAFGFAGIYDQDEAERIASVPEQVKDVASVQINGVKRGPPPPEDIIEVEVIDPEIILGEIDHVLSAALDVGSLNTIHETSVIPLLTKLTFPSDKDNADKVFDKHFKRVSQK
jgi:phage recombination protein Bet